MSHKTMIVGLGQIGMGYDLALDPATYVYSHARAYAQHPAFTLVAGVDNIDGQRAAFAQHFHCPAYRDLESALAAHQPDIVVIAAPTPYHSAALKTVLALSSPKAILCEKPLAYDLHDAREMVALCEARGIALFVNYMRRSDSAAIEVKRRLESGEIAGPGIKGVCWYSKGFQHNGSHFFNLLQYWLGPSGDAQLIDAGRLWNGTEHEPDARVRFEGGDVVFLAAREEAFSHYTIELVAANGRLRYDQGGKTVSWQSAVPDARLTSYTYLSPEPEAIATGMDRYQWHVAEQLSLALAGSPHAALCSGRDALATLEAMQSIIDDCAPAAGAAH